MPLNVSGDDSLVWRTGLDNTFLGRGIAQAQGLLTRFTANITALDVFAGLAISATIAFAIVARRAYSASKEFETAMREVSSISQTVQTNFEAISEAVITLSTEVPQSALELARALYQITSAGFDGADALKVLDASAKGAVAGVTDTATAADGLTTVMNAFRKETSEVTIVADIMFQTVKLGKTTFDELSSTIATVAPLAASSNISFEELSAAIATLTKSGVPTAEAMTQIRAAILSLNGALGDGWQETMTLQEAMLEMTRRAEGSQNALRKLAKRVEAMNAILGLTGANTQAAALDLIAMQNAAGSAADAFEIMAQTTENQFALLANNITAFIFPIGDAVLDLIGGFVKQVNSLFTETAEGAQKSLALEKDLLSVLRSSNSNIGAYVAELEELANKTELSTEETNRLRVVEESLKLLIPQVSDEWEKQATILDKVALAKSRLQELDEDILKQQLRTSRAGVLATTESLILSEQARDQAEQDADTLRDKIDQSVDRLTDILALSQQLNLASGTRFFPEFGRNLLKDIDVYQQKVDEINKDAKLSEDQRIAKVRELAEQIVLTNEKRKEAVRLADSANFVTNQSVLNNKILLEDYKTQVNEIGAILRGETDRAEKIKELVSDLPPELTLEAATEVLEERFALFKRHYKDVAAFSEEEGERLQEAWLLPLDFIAGLEALRDEFDDTTEKGIKQIEDNNESILQARKVEASIQKEAERAITKVRQERLKVEQEISRALKSEYEVEVLDVREKYDKLIADALTFNKDIVELEEKKQSELAELAERQTAETFRAEFDRIQSALNAGIDIGEEGLRNQIKLLTELRSKYKNYGEIVLLLNKRIEQTQQRINRLRLDRLTDIAGGLSNIAAIAENVNKSFADMVNSVSSSLEVFRNVKEVGLASFSGVTGAIGATIGVINTARNVLGKLFGGDTVKEGFERALKAHADRLKALQTGLNRTLDNLAVNRKTALGQEDIDILKQMIQLTKDLSDIPITGRTPEELEENLQRRIRARGEIIDLEKEVSEILTGTSIEEIGDLIVDQFQRGELAVEDFAGTIDTLISNALINAFKRDLLQSSVREFQKQFQLDIESGEGLSIQEIESLRTVFGELITDASQQFEALQQILSDAGVSSDLGGAQREGLSGAIQGITEDTAGLLAGQFTAIRINTIEILTSVEQISLYAQETAENTTYLGRIYSLLQEGSVKVETDEDVLKAQGA